LPAAEAAAGCPYRKSNPDVLMVQTSEVWGGHDTANGLHSTGGRGKLLGLELAVTIRLGSRALGAAHMRLLPSVRGVRPAFVDRLRSAYFLASGSQNFCSFSAADRREPCAGCRLGHGTIGSGVPERAVSACQPIE
jgi:hypothetical protein